MANICPKCNHDKSICDRTKSVDGGVQRYRRCLKCRATYKTEEKVIANSRSGTKKKKRRLPTNEEIESMSD